jgi:valyl-tRNA synthetase
LHFPAEEEELETVMDAIRAVRNRRAEMNVPPSKKSTLYVVTEHQKAFCDGQAFITKLAYAEELFVSDTAPEGHEDMVLAVTADAKLYMPMEQLVDFEKELARIAKEQANAEKNLQRIEAKLSNQGFLAKAPEAVVNSEKEKAEQLRKLLSQLEQSAARLKK